MKVEIFKVSGMTSESCAEIIEKNVHKIQGINDAVVNFYSQKLTVRYDGNKVIKEDIIDSVQNTGYIAKERMDISKPPISKVADIISGLVDILYPLYWL